jgi:hypothetical protein
VQARTQGGRIKRGAALAGFLVIKGEGCFVGGNELITGDLRLAPGMTDRMRKTQPLGEEQTHHNPNRDGDAASLARCVMIHRWVPAMHSLVGA